MEETDLNNLLANAEQLALNPEENIGELPRIERTLKQVYDATNELWSRLTSEGLRDTEANLLLSTRGVDLPHLSMKLDRITARRSLQPLDPTPVTDIDAYLKNELDNSILATVDFTSQKFEEYFQKNMDEELKKSARERRLKFLNCLHGISELDPEVPVIRKIYPLRELYLSGASNLDQYQIAYAEALLEYNRDIQNGKTGLNLMSKLMAVVPEHDQKIRELWKIASTMSQIPLSTKSVFEARAGFDSGVRNRLVFLARTYLEENYKVFMESIVVNNMLKACRGGEPGTYSLVRSFIKAANFTEYLGMEQVFIDGLPFWPVFYYCLRCGDLDAALHTLKQLGNDFDDFTKIILELKSSSNRRLSSASEKNFVEEYNRMVRNTPDPFKRIVYCFIGSCDTRDKHPEVVKTTDDFLWLKLCQINLDSSEDYNSFQRFIETEYGPIRVSSEQPNLYFQIYFLSGLFETAIQELYLKPNLAIHGVHIAIALQELGVLGLTDNLQRSTFLSHYPLPQPHMALNISTMIKTYVNTLPDEDIEISLNYLYCLRNVCYIVNKQEEWMFPKYAFELVIKTERYNEILGFLEPDGCRVKGLYDQFSGSKIQTNDLIDQVAHHLETKGEYFTAMKLYELCGNYEKTMWVWSSQMSRCLTDRSRSSISQFSSHAVNKTAKFDLSEASNKQSEDIKKKLYEYSELFIKRTNIEKISIHAETKEIFDALHLLYTFHQYYKNKEYQTALLIMQQSKFLPFTSDEVELKVNEFKCADMMVIQTLPDTLLSLMHILSSQYTNLKNNIGRQPDAAFHKAIALIHEKAEALTSFAGRLPFQFTSSTYSVMMNMAVNMR